MDIARLTQIRKQLTTGLHYLQAGEFKTNTRSAWGGSVLLVVGRDRNGEGYTVEIEGNRPIVTANMVDEEMVDWLVAHDWWIV